jgi:vacuolar-type H+-ATPase subunit I/STV1
VVWRDGIIVLHAVAASIALGAGLVALPMGRLLGVYQWAFAGALAFLTPALAIDWGVSDNPARVRFSVLFAIGVVVLRRAILAGRIRPTVREGPSSTYLDHVGFGLIALSVAFAITAALHVGAPSWLEASSGVGVTAIGYGALRAVKARLVDAVATEDSDGAGGGGKESDHSGPSVSSPTD